MNPGSELDDLGYYIEDLYDRALRTGDYSTRAFIERTLTEVLAREPSPLEVARRDEQFGVES